MKGDGGADELFLYRTFKVVCPSPTRLDHAHAHPKKRAARDDDETATADGMRCLGLAGDGRMRGCDLLMPRRQLIQYHASSGFCLVQKCMYVRTY